MRSNRENPLLTKASGIARTRRGEHAFTLIETLVLIGLLIILLSIFIPYVGSIRESSRRVACQNNLYQIRDALQKYAGDNNHELPRVVYDAVRHPTSYTVFTGADDSSPFALDSGVRPNDVTASLWLLVHIGYVPDTRVFICPSSGDSRDLMLGTSGEPVKPSQRGNFRRPENLSYAYSCPFSIAPGFRNNDTKPGLFALMADKGPGPEATKHRPTASARELAAANSPNHRGVGQNVLFADGSVRFFQTPYCGVRRTDDGSSRILTPGDNIYTAFAPQPATQPTAVPLLTTGYVGFNVVPASNDDSYLVPSALDVVPVAGQIMIPTPASQPDSRSATATRPTTSRPATTTASATAEGASTAPATTQRAASTAPTTTGPRAATAASTLPPP